MMSNRRETESVRQTLQRASWLIRIALLLASADCQTAVFLTHARQAWLLAPALVWFVLAFVLALDVPRSRAYTYVLISLAAALVSTASFLFVSGPAFLIAVICNIVILAVTVFLLFRTKK